MDNELSLANICSLAIMVFVLWVIANTMKLPISYESRYDEECDGYSFAASREEAMAQFDINGWRAVDAYESTSEVGRVYQSRGECSEAYAEEIKAGYCRVLQVWAGFKAEFSHWVIESVEIDSD